MAKQRHITRRGAWWILLVSALFEAIWATALGQSAGLNNVTPTIIFAVALAASMVGLAMAMQHIEIGTAYAVWVGIGAVLTVTYAMLTGEETISIAKVLFLAGIVGCTVGLKYVGHTPQESPHRNATEEMAQED